jgi:hypothetical protein
VKKGTVSILLRILNDPDRKSLLKISYETFHLWIRNKHFPTYYFTRLLFLPEWGDYRDYISTRELFKIIYSEKIHSPEIVEILNDKIRFAKFCIKNNLPAPKLLGYSIKNVFIFNERSFKIENISDAMAFFNQLFHEIGLSKIIVKNIVSKGGKGILILNKNSLGEQLPGVYDTLLNQSFVFQEIVSNHDLINKIYEHSVNTLRVDTLYVDKEVHVLGACMRFGVGGNLIDNASAGGFYVPMDHIKGTLLKYGVQNIQNNGRCFRKHPDTDFVLKGFEVPFYKESIQLVKELTRLLPNKIIGWDIAVTNEGPLVIEGNHDPGIVMTEIAHKGYRKHPLIRRLLEISEG